ncbi:hypothetical protein [Burkholderia contaminans]|uniref:hypothetical protein n=1 Tax=Burkholderia contaminans TaxID=488447 RepID=UPI000AEC86E1|nr:hypothetical protein [Burkholderia contaminans]MEB4629299.1 hypothetical protein [Burkholderia contaminans]MEB4635481.1 hypothetical protein [Burkholderia contaminans]MEB4651297.1 hypothetical protein [Burkholderia contaminans]MEB4661812.1 hypothetical protein [Burkholderia contaminans]MEB4666576.1 hypothetical protein [Burkholderia contaminans]
MITSLQHTQRHWAQAFGDAILKDSALKLAKPRVPLFREGTPYALVTHVGTMLAMTMLWSGLASAAPQSTLRFALPGGAAVIYSNAANPRDPLPHRAWKKAVFSFPDGTTFGLLPRAGESNAGGGTQMEPPDKWNISPSGQYVIVMRNDQGTVFMGQGQPETVLNREYCSMIEITTGCITAEQTGEICGAGWQPSQGAQWGTDSQTSMMLTRERPLASNEWAAINAGQPPHLLMRDASGADNLLRCDPPSSANRESYRKIAVALKADGARFDAQLIDAALSKGSTTSVGTSVAQEAGAEGPTAAVSVAKATLFTAPDDATASRAYLVRNDVVTVLKQSPAGWAYVDYVSASGKHLLRWIKADQISIKQ